MDVPTPRRRPCLAYALHITINDVGACSQIKLVFEFIIKLETD